MQIALVYNPHMAQARLAKVAALAKVLAARGHSLAHHDSQAFRSSGEDLICVCGGDGTAQLVISNQGDCAALPRVAVYPTGTINLLARELGYPADPEAFARRIEDRRDPVSSRLATINGRPFLCCVSVGADAHAVAALSEPLKARIGRFAYVAALLKVMARWPRQVLTVESSAGPFSAEAMFVLRGNLYAGPWTLDAQAGLGHDSLRLIVLPKARRRDMIRLMLHAFAGSGKPPRGWPVHDVQWVRTTGQTALPMQIDGDAAGTTPLDIRMTGDRVRFV